MVPPSPRARVRVRVRVRVRLCLLQRPLFRLGLSRRPPRRPGRSEEIGAEIEEIGAEIAEVAEIGLLVELC